MKKIFSFLFSFVFVLILLVGTSIPASAAETAFSRKKNEVIQGNTIHAEAVDIWDGGNYVCITEKIETAEAPNGTVQPHIIESFKHTIWNSNGDFVAYFTSTVTGVTTGVEATILSVTGSFSNAAVSGLSYSASCNGNRATVNILLNGAKIGSLGYKISLDGTISQV